MTLRFMGKWMNSINRHEVTDQHLQVKYVKDVSLVKKIKFHTGLRPQRRDRTHDNKDNVHWGPAFLSASLYAFTTEAKFFRI